jgi:hypothetical protein
LKKKSFYKLIFLILKNATNEVKFKEHVGAKPPGCHAQSEHSRALLSPSSLSRFAVFFFCLSERALL